LVGFLEAMRKSGTPSGRALSYRLEVRPDGQVLLNGNDMMPLIGAMSASTK
jgi:hypothetical protein